MAAYENGRNAYRDALAIDPGKELACTGSMKVTDQHSLLLDNDAIKEQLEMMEVGSAEIMEGV